MPVHTTLWMRITKLEPILKISFPIAINFAFGAIPVEWALAHISA
jgi:hypothetical protein